MHGMNMKVIHLCFYIGFIDVQYLLESDRNRSKHVAVVPNCAKKKIILTSVRLLVLFV